jgi:hypothetical protein
MKPTVRDAGKVLSQLSDLPNKPIIAKVGLSIQIPVRFREIELAQIGASTFVYGLFAIILDTGEYALCNVNAYVELGPTAVDIVQVDDVDYYNFHFEPGQVVIKTKELIARANLIYKAIEEFVFKGKVPWYIDYEDMGKLFDTANFHAKSKAEFLPSVTEFMAAYAARSKGDRIKYIREVATNYAGFDKKYLEWVPLRSVYWSAPGTVNKLAGAYFSDGVVSALVNPSERTEKIERILRT